MALLCLVRMTSGVAADEDTTVPLMTVDPVITLLMVVLVVETPSAGLVFRAAAPLVVMT